MSYTCLVTIPTDLEPSRLTIFFRVEFAPSGPHTVALPRRHALARVVRAHVCTCTSTYVCVQVDVHVYIQLSQSGGPHYFVKN